MNGEHSTDSQDPERPGPRHARVYPVEERGRRIRWRMVTIAIYLALTGGAMWGAHALGWPEQIGIPVVAVPYLGGDDGRLVTLWPGRAWTRLT